MKISKTVSGLVITGVLLAGWQKGYKAEEVTEAVTAVPVTEAAAPVSTPSAVIEAVSAVEATAPAATPAVEAAPAAVVPAAPAAEVTPAVPAQDATGAAPEVTAPIVPVPAHTENKEEGSPVILSIAELYAKKAELKGKNVTIFGKVVKVNKGVMGRNWLHVQDGTGAQGTNDLTITTEGIANPNDKVSVTGIVVLDKDFGAGYKYELIIEDALVKVQ